MSIWDPIMGQAFNDPDSGVAPGMTLNAQGQWVAPDLRKKGNQYFKPVGGSLDELRSKPAYAPLIDQFLKSGDLMQDESGQLLMSTQAQDQFSEVAGIKDHGWLDGILTKMPMILGGTMSGAALGGAFPGMSAAGSAIPAGQSGILSQLGISNPFSNPFSSQAPVTEGQWNLTGNDASWGVNPRVGDSFDMFRDAYSQFNGPTNPANFDVFRDAYSAVNGPGPANFDMYRQAYPSGGLNPAAPQLSDDAYEQQGMENGSNPSTPASDAQSGIPSWLQTLGKTLLGSKAGSALSSGDFSSLLDSNPFGDSGLLGLGARLAPGYAALEFAKNQGDVDTSPLSNLLGQPASAPVSTAKFDNLYNAYGGFGQQIKDITDPYQGSVLKDYDLRTGAARGELLGNLDRRGVSGSSFGNSDLFNFDTSSQAQRGKLAGDIGLQGLGLNLQGMAGQQAAATGAAGVENANRQYGLNLQGQQGTLATQLLNAQLQQKAIQSALYGRAFDVMGRAVAPSTSIYGR